ncbi:hypothetical protein MKS88_001305 [Plasmodium brasilianum]|uniref:Uncharacterized protein n=2 Tax=Plasmodium (Plasmodium) TaxID=418103 RepID=A0A1A8VV24_PLAMA|nr:hypothetical protein MKS88_001305 [Plasmodium brasilianum]SBS82679.1 hypothetical protein PMALA_004200 [Plasmodium malariae]
MNAKVWVSEFFVPLVVNNLSESIFKLDIKKKKKKKNNNSNNSSSNNNNNSNNNNSNNSMNKHCGRAINLKFQNSFGRTVK